MKSLLSPLFLLVLSGSSVLAVENAAELYQKMIPEDKNLPADWVESLTTRGHALDAGIKGSKKNDSLRYVGMPVGGIACGSLVMDGAGQLYAWDVFGQKRDGLVEQIIDIPEGYPGFKDHQVMRTLDGANYMNPPSYEKFPPPVDQGFSVKVKGGAEYQLGMDDWDKIEFTGKWPMGIVDYEDADSPLKVTLNAYSPFIPLDIERSNLPVTVMSYTVTNTSSEDLTVEFSGWLGYPKAENTEYKHSDSVSSLNHSYPLKVKTGRKTISVQGSLGLAVLGQTKEFKKGNSKGLISSRVIAAGKSETFTSLITWQGGLDVYARRFKDSQAVTDYVVSNFDKLSSETKLWVDTWNDTTLPQWFIDRSMATASTMQTSNLQFNKGRFWAWEGIGAGTGTCTHVWAYAQSMARLFPSLERNLREKTDFGFAQTKTGGVKYRSVNNKNIIAIDGQCGIVNRTYREHLISADSEFLKRNWTGVKKAMNYLIEFDKNDDAYDGLLDGEQHNTLDAEWFGKVHVLCSLYLSALRSGEEMAIEMGDKAFEKLCRDTFNMGSKNIEKLYNGEYYVQLEDAKHPDAIGVGKGVYIDQVYGQFWANQVGLGSLYDQDHIKSALNTIWKHNFILDAGEFRKEFLPGRFYAWKGEGGVLMCTWPNGGIREDFKKHWQYGYFNEIMSGFEHQLAAHMISQEDEAFMTKGLAIMRTIHDRYAPEKRNPYNEVEYSDFYARAMASYGSFLEVCGYHYNGPKKEISFAPLISQNNFKTAYTAAEGWGTYTQVIEPNKFTASIALKWGKLSLQTLNLKVGEVELAKIVVTHNNKILDAKLTEKNGLIQITLTEPVNLVAGQQLNIFNQ